VLANEHVFVLFLFFFSFGTMGRSKEKLSILSFQVNPIKKNEGCSEDKKN
jgi:hypothetical protein